VFANEYTWMSQNGVHFVLTKWTPFSVNFPTVDWELFAKSSKSNFTTPINVVAVSTSQAFST
jgi:hypothetical protein